MREHPKFKPLSMGDTIGVLALASPSERKRLNSGVDFLRSLGFKVKVALQPAKAYGKATHLFSSDTAKRRAQALNKFFADTKIKAVISSRGGYGSMEILPYLNFKLIAKNPKPVIGISDITAVLLAIHKLARIPVVHAATIESAFSKAREEPEAKASALELVNFLSQKSAPFSAQPKLKLIMGSAKAVQGKLLGGNLSLICSLLATPWEPDLSGTILCIEDIAEKPYRIHRMLLQLKLAGKLNKVRAVLLGNFSACTDSRPGSAKLEDVFKHIFADLKVPVWGYAAFGHELRNLPIPFGVRARIRDGKLALTQQLFTAAI